LFGAGVVVCLTLNQAMFRDQNLQSRNKFTKRIKSIAFRHTTQDRLVNNDDYNY
jgi:hypothetical protein